MTVSAAKKRGLAAIQLIQQRLRVFQAGQRPVDSHFALPSLFGQLAA